MSQSIYHHIYNRGAHKAPIFLDSRDYWRMLMLFYISNSTKPFVISRFAEQNIFMVDREQNLVDIIAYCLMPNHIHLSVREKLEGGISLFMKKVATGYSMYYNFKYLHSGAVWQGRYKTSTALDQESLQKLINYIHLNPYGLKDPTATKEARSENLKEAIEFSSNYEYSSLKDFNGERRLQTPILGERGPTSRT